MLLRSAALMILVPVLISCGSSSDLGNGFKIVDNGGSKLSLEKDGIIVINYTITGVGSLENLTIIENRNYGTDQCEYYIVDENDRLVRINDNYTAPAGISRDLLVQAVEPINSRSCRTS